MKNKKILISGGTGFIGTYLINALKENNEVYSISRSKGSQNNVTWIQQDLGEELDTSRLPSEIDIVIHLAMDPLRGESTKSKLKGISINFLGTYQLLEYAKKASAKTFLFTSTGSIYGNKENPSKEEDKFDANDFYSFTKYAAELLVNQYKENFTIIILRPFHPYGPGQKDSFLVPRLIKNIRNNETINVNNKETPKLSPIYIEDAINIILKSLKLNENLVLNAAGNKFYSVYDICEIIGRLLNKKVNYNFINDKNTKNLLGDMEYTSTKLSYIPKTNLEEGIKKLL